MRGPLNQALKTFDVWSIDFIHDSLDINGIKKSFRALNHYR